MIPEIRQIKNMLTQLEFQLELAMSKMESCKQENEKLKLEIQTLKKGGTN